MTKFLIGETVYFVITIAVFVIAISAALARAYIRIWLLKRVKADDYFFFIAVGALISGTGLLFATIQDQYISATAGLEITSLPPDWIRKAGYISVYALSAEVLSWITISAVKLSFLFYFRILIDRLHKMTVWWWFTLIIVILQASMLIGGNFIPCPYVGPSKLLKCNTTEVALRKTQEQAFLYYSAAADITTDLMLISIPLIILRSSKLRIRQKVSIGLVLCLSILMIAISLLRIISAVFVGPKDLTWNSFWVQIEASISVIAACPTAFRTLFLVNRGPDETPEHECRQRSAPKRLWRMKPDLPSINVGATMTGVKSFIRENGRSHIESADV